MLMQSREGAKDRSVVSVTSRSLICRAAALTVQPWQEMSEREPRQGPTMMRQPWQSLMLICSVGSRMAIVHSWHDVIFTAMLKEGQVLLHEPGGLQ